MGASIAESTKSLFMVDSTWLVDCILHIEGRELGLYRVGIDCELKEKALCLGSVVPRVGESRV